MMVRMDAPLDQFEESDTPALRVNSVQWRLQVDVTFDRTLRSGCVMM